MFSKNEITFSIIVPIFNSESSIERCVLSVVAQKFKNWELILVDDGSYDNSVSICKYFQSKHPDKIKIIISEKNEGQLSARFKGVLSSSGAYVLFLDSDDTYENDTLFILDQALKMHPSDLISFNPNLIGAEAYKSIDIFTQKKVIYGTEKIVKEYLCNRIYGYSCFFAIKKSIALNAFSKTRTLSDLRYTEDLAFMFNVYNLSNLCYQLDEKLYNYYVTSDSASTNVNIKKYRDRFVCFNFIYGKNIFPSDVDESTKLQIFFAVMSYARESCFLTKKEAKSILKEIRNSALFARYKKDNGNKERISKLMVKLLNLRMYHLFIVVTKKYYKRNHEKKN